MAKTVKKTPKRRTPKGERPILIRLDEPLVVVGDRALVVVLPGTSSPAEKAIRKYKALAADESLSIAARKRAWKKVVEEVARLTELGV
jgi:hypothetical protein